MLIMTQLLYVSIDLIIQRLVYIYVKRYIYAQLN